MRFSRLLFLCLISFAGSCQPLHQDSPLSTPKVVNPREERVDERIRLGMAMLVVHSPASANSTCSSVLVGDGILLTARHCVTDRIGNTLRVKTPDQFGWVSPAGKQTEPMVILDVRAHPTKDLGIIKVKGMPKESHIFPLVKNRVLTKEDNFMVAGYGRVFESGKEVVSRKNFLNWGWTKFKKKKPVQVVQTFGKQIDNLEFESIGGSWANSSSAEGDSGGGIFLVEGDKISLAGITSYGFGEPSSISGAANVQGEEKWIGIAAQE